MVGGAMVGVAVVGGVVVCGAVVGGTVVGCGGWVCCVSGDCGCFGHRGGIKKNPAYGTQLIDPY